MFLFQQQKHYLILIWLIRSAIGAIICIVVMIYFVYVGAATHDALGYGISVAFIICIATLLGNLWKLININLIYIYKMTIFFFFWIHLNLYYLFFFA